MSPATEHFENIENLLKLMLRDIRDGAKGSASQEGLSGPQSPALEFESTLEHFRSQAATIRHLFERFQRSDHSTKLYVQKHIEEEFASLESAYRTLSNLFTKQDRDH